MATKKKHSFKPVFDSHLVSFAGKLKDLIEENMVSPRRLDTSPARTIRKFS
jgi:hypothetical protein